MSTIELVKKVFTQQADWPDKEQFLDVIYWGRQILGIILGLFWGLLPMKGFVGLVLFAALSAGIVYVWFTAVQVCWVGVCGVARVTIFCAGGG
jgi:hypothetical protein